MALLPIAIGVLGEVHVIGITVLLAVPVSIVATKVVEKAQAIMKKLKQPKKCDYCGQLKLNEGSFWDELPQKAGKFKANKFACYYKDMKWQGKRLEFFKRTGHQCPHQGEVCAKCGYYLSGPKGHQHPKECPFK